MWDTISTQVGVRDEYRAFERSPKFSKSNSYCNVWFAVFFSTVTISKYHHQILNSYVAHDIVIDVIKKNSALMLLKLL